MIVNVNSEPGGRAIALYRPVYTPFFWIRKLPLHDATGGLIRWLDCPFLQASAGQRDERQLKKKS